MVRCSARLLESFFMQKMGTAERIGWEALVEKEGAT